MDKLLCASALTLLLVTAALAGGVQQGANIGGALSPDLLAKAEAPVVLCVDDKPTLGGQPTSTGYAKAAANGFRSVLTLRAPSDNVDLARERFIVEQNNMRYFNIPISRPLPRRPQVEHFLQLVRDKANHPMLLNCAFAERVAPFMMIFRIVEHGWREDRAIEEAAQSGIKSAVLRKFVKEYFAARAARSARMREAAARALDAERGNTRSDQLRRIALEQHLP